MSVSRRSGSRTARGCASGALVLAALGLSRTATAEPRDAGACPRPAGYLGALVLDTASRGSAAASCALVDLTTQLPVSQLGLADAPGLLSPDDRARFPPFAAAGAAPQTGAPRKWFANLEDKIPLVSFLLRKNRVAVADGHELTLTVGWPPGVDVKLSW